MVIFEINVSVFVEFVSYIFLFSRYELFIVIALNLVVSFIIENFLTHHILPYAQKMYWFICMFFAKITFFCLCKYGRLGMWSQDDADQANVPQTTEMIVLSTLASLTGSTPNPEGITHFLF